MSIINVIGPVMVGPSSSHTAGAVKIGKFAYNYIGGIPQTVRFILHGSFATTYMGHGTDKALLSGIIGFNVDDIRIKDIFEIIKKYDLRYEFLFEDLGYVLPNTVSIIAEKDSVEYKIQACSVGAGEILVNEIDGNSVKLNGHTPALSILNKDITGALSEILKIISAHGINVANVTLNRVSKIFEEASCIIELDEAPSYMLVQELQKSSYVISCRYIPEI